MRKLLFVLMLLFTVSCTTQRSFVNYSSGKYMMVAYDTLLSQEGFNNLCLEENINPDYNKWIRNSQRDYETKRAFNTYLFIGKMDTTEVKYRLMIKDSIYNLNKIITTNTK